MKFFVQSQSELWRKNIDADIGSECVCLADGSINPHFPWSMIRGHTETLLKKKGSTTADDQEHRLIALICRHVTTVNALAACAHILSAKGVKACLVGEYGRLPGLHNEMSTYLQAIIAIHHINPAAINATDAGLAKALFPLCKLDSTAAGQSLQIVTNLWVLGVPAGSLVQDEIEVTTQNACKSFSAHLKSLVAGSLWTQAAQATAWMPSLLDSITRSPSENKLSSILSKELPEWRAWALWKP